MARLLILLGVALLASLSMAHTSTATGCGSDNRSCVKGKAECISGKCQCKHPNIWGDGRFNCYRKNTVAAEIKNDPKLTNFNNETISFPFPCRSMATHVRQQLKDQNNQNVIGSCEFMIHTFNGKARGKFYNYGFEVAAFVTYNDGRVVKMTSRHFGHAENGAYEFTNEGSDGYYWPNGPWNNDDIGYEDAANNIKIEVKKNYYNNQLIYEFKKCGLRITFVPYDYVLKRDQVSIPGVAIAINCAHQPIWLSYDKVMALSPWWQEGARFENLKIPGLDNEKSMIVRAFTRGYEQNQPYLNDESNEGHCEATHNALTACSDSSLLDAMNNCYWMLKQPRFINCMDKSTSAKDILHLFSSCVNVWCGGGSCAQVQQMIIDKNCHNKENIDELPMFMAGSMCPLA